VVGRWWLPHSVEKAAPTHYAILVQSDIHILAAMLQVLCNIPIYSLPHLSIVDVEYILLKLGTGRYPRTKPSLTSHAQRSLGNVFCHEHVDDISSTSKGFREVVLEAQSG